MEYEGGRKTTIHKMRASNQSHIFTNNSPQRWWHARRMHSAAAGVTRVISFHFILLNLLSHDPRRRWRRGMTSWAEISVSSLKKLQIRIKERQEKEREES
jgi:hypothetical protein